MTAAKPCRVMKRGFGWPSAIDRVRAERYVFMRWCPDPLVVVARTTAPFRHARQRLRYQGVRLAIRRPSGCGRRRATVQPYRCSWPARPRPRGLR